MKEKSVRTIISKGIRGGGGKDPYQRDLPSCLLSNSEITWGYLQQKTQLQRRERGSTPRNIQEGDYKSCYDNVLKTILLLKKLEGLKQKKMNY